METHKKIIVAYLAYILGTVAKRPPQLRLGARGQELFKLLEEVIPQLLSRRWEIPEKTTIDMIELPGMMTPEEKAAFARIFPTFRCRICKTVSIPPEWNEAALYFFTEDSTSSFTEDGHAFSPLKKNKRKLFDENFLEFITTSNILSTL